MGAWFVVVRGLVYAWGYPVIFLMIVLESIPLIGVVIPGGTFALLGAGIFSRFGLFDVATAYLVCLLATMFIDHTGYVTGRLVSKRRFHSWLKTFFVKESLIKRIGKLIHCHLGKTIVFGRLNPPIRSIVPFMVGNEKVSYRKFLPFSLVSAIIWVTLFFTVGYLLANSISRIDSITRLITWAIVILIISIYFYYLIKNAYLRKGGINGFDCEKQGERRNGA